jgi:thiol-disulfide isomerase/thioredoxin
MVGTRRLRNSRGRFLAARPIDVNSDAQIPQLTSMLRRGPMTFVLVYADWCGHCQRYKPMWKQLTGTPGRIANMAAVRDDMFKKIPAIKDAKIAGYPSVIKVSPDGRIERFKVNGEETNAMDSAKMRNMAAMKKEITTPPKRVMASEMASIEKTPESSQPLNVTRSIMKERGQPVPSTPDFDYKPVTSMQGSKQGPSGEYRASTPGSLLTSDDLKEVTIQTGGGLSIAAAFASAVQSVGPAALLLAAHSLLPKRSHTYRSPKRSSHRGGTRRARHH